MLLHQSHVCNLLECLPFFYASCFILFHPVFLCNPDHKSGPTMSSTKMKMDAVHVWKGVQHGGQSCNIPHLCVGHAGAVGPPPSNIQHQQIGAETEPSGRPGHPQVLRLHQWETEIPQLFCLRSVLSHLAEEMETSVVGARTHFSGFAFSDKDSQSVSRIIHQSNVQFCYIHIL